MTDFDTRAKISAPSTNVFADLDLPYQAKALEVWCAFADEADVEFTSDQVRRGVSAISSALKEAVEEEREACAKICDDPEGRFTAFKDSVSRLVAQMTALAFADAIRSRKEP